MNEPELFFSGKRDDFVEIFNFSSELIKSSVIVAGAAGMFPENKSWWRSTLPKIKDHFL